MRGFIEDFPCAARFNDTPRVHYGDVVADFRNDAQIVGNQNHGHAEFSDQVADQFQNLCLNGNVKGSRRFVGEEQLRIARERYGDDYALLHAARKLMRIIVCARFGDPHELQHFFRFFECRFFIDFFMQHIHLRNLFAHGHDGIQCGHRILEDHGNVGTAHLFQIFLFHRKNVFAVDAYGSAHDFSRRRGDKAEYGKRGRRFSRARFTDESERLLFFQ